MMGARITLLGSQHDAAVSFMQEHPNGHERAIAILFRHLHTPVEGLSDSDRYIACDVIPFEESWVTDSSPQHVSFSLAPLRELFRRCEEENLVFGFIHNHPSGPADFSAIDEENEITLFKALSNRNGKNITFISMLWADGKWLARTRSGLSSGKATPARHILVLGDRVHLYGYKESSEENREALARQAAAFGEPLVDMLQSLRVGVVGNGGTGSPFATLAARSGVGELVLIDKDKLAPSNLNRVRGLMRCGVGKIKSNSLKSFIESIGLSVKAAAIESEVDTSPEAVDALASCDIIIGCTDDFIGRKLMNTALYIYAQPLIDIGLGGQIDEGKDGHPYLRYHRGRISTILPESGQCLFCQEVINETWVAAQYARRENPDITQEELKEKYLEEGDTNAPGVGPFTNATADFAMATLFDLIKPFRKFPPEVRRDMFFLDFVKMEISSHNTGGAPNCPYCRKHNFLIKEETYRLERPMLGKRNEFN